MNNVGLILFGHGSRVAEANQSVMAVTEALRERGGYRLTATAFLELAEPDLPAAVAALVAQGARRIVVIPYFLTLGIHLRRDLPRIVEELESIHPGVEILVTDPLDGHPALLDIVMARAGAAVGSL
jgi:sirohydrochlorin ferrochelatase